MQELTIEQDEAQDTEVQDVAEEMSDILQAAFDVLIQRRDRQYADAISPLDVERDTLEQESASIEEARVNLERLLPAKAREAQRAADALLLAGEHEAATAKLTEVEEATNAPALMNQPSERLLRASRPSKLRKRPPLVASSRRGIKTAKRSSARLNTGCSW